MNAGRLPVAVSAAKSHEGAVRGVNEDAYLDRPDIGLWVVADGVGGHDDGEFASHLIVNALERLASEADAESLAGQVETVLVDVNRRLCEKSMADECGEPIGSTVVALVVVGDAGVCLWAGDSRLYRLRNNTLQQISRDHSEVEELVEDGLVSREEARNHPKARFITRAVGATEQLELDSQALAIEVDDVYLLCSDGLTKTISDHEISEILITASCPDAARALIHLALVRDAPDNVTVVVVSFTDAARQG